MFILESKHKEALKKMQEQRDRAAAVARQLFEEKNSAILFTGLLLKRLGGVAEIPIKELVEADGQFAIAEEGEGEARKLVLEIVVKREGPPIVPPTPECDDCGDDCIHQQPVPVTA